MTPDDISNAITGAIGQGGETWLVATLVAFLPILWTMTLILHLGRPYVLRNLRRMGLRLGADVWWMTYLLLRDAVMLVTLGVSLDLLPTQPGRQLGPAYHGAAHSLVPSARSVGQAVAAGR